MHWRIGDEQYDGVLRRTWSRLDIRGDDWSCKFAKQWRNDNWQAVIRIGKSDTDQRAPAN